MITIVKWLVRFILAYIFIDWFIMRVKNDEIILKPAGAILIDINEPKVVQCSFGCGAEDLHDGDVVYMEIRLVNEETNREKNIL